MRGAESVVYLPSLEVLVEYTSNKEVVLVQDSKTGREIVLHTNSSSGMENMGEYFKARSVCDWPLLCLNRESESWAPALGFIKSQSE